MTNITVTTNITTKMTNKGIKYNHLITVNGKEFKRNSVNKFKYCLLVNADCGWIVDSYSSEIEGLSSKVSYWKKVKGSKIGQVRSFETKIIEINE